jgi:hypothetical protein
MVLRRLAKWQGSVANGACPALYCTDDPTMMIGQGKKLTTRQTAELLDVAGDEAAVAIPTETVFRGVAKYATEHGDDDLAGKIEEFLTARGL